MIRIMRQREYSESRHEENDYCAGLGCVPVPDQPPTELDSLRQLNAELLQALTRMLRHFADEDGGLCIECGEVTGTGKGCDTCYVLGEAEAVIKKAREASRILFYEASPELAALG